MFTPAGKYIQFAGRRIDQFVKHRFFAGFGTQYAPEPLNMFAYTGTAGNDYADIGFRHVHAFVENFAGNQHRAGTRPEILQHIAPFGTLGMMSEYRQIITPAQFISRRVICGKNDNSFSGMAFQKLPDHIEFFFAAAGNAFLLEVSFKSFAAGLSAAGGFHDKVAP